MLQWILFAAVGRLLVYFWQKFQLPQALLKSSFIVGLHDCALCSGVWVYTVLSFLMGVDLLQSWFGFSYVIGLSELVTGCVTSYVITLLVTGFTEFHMKIVIV